MRNSNAKVPWCENKNNYNVLSVIGCVSARNYIGLGVIAGSVVYKTNATFAGKVSW